MPELSPEKLSCWNENGYMIIKRCFASEHLDAINELIDSLWQMKPADISHPIVSDIFLSTDREQRLHFRNVPDEARHEPYKLNDLYLWFNEIRDVVLSERLSPVIAELLGGAPMVCNNLNLEYGSQQQSHQDTLYMPSRVPNKMVASWIALEQATGNNGPLVLYPGSHKIPPYLFSNGRTNAIGSEMQGYVDYIEEKIAENAIEPVEFHAEKGDLLIWHSQLLHGGSAIAERGSTRKSLVTHYFRRKDYLHRLWKIRKHQSGAYYYAKRPIVA